MKEKSKNKKRRHLEDGEDDSPVPIKQIKDALGDAVDLSSKKKKRKMDTGDHGHGDGDSAGDARHEKKRKKKAKDAFSKKKKGDRKLSLKDIEKSDSPDSVRLVNKKKKKKELGGDKNVVDGSEVVRAEKRKNKGKVTSSDLNCGDTDISASISKTKKKGHDASVAETDKMGTSGAVKQKEKKKKKQKNKQSDVGGLSENVVSVRKKRKKEKSVAGTCNSEVLEKSKKEIDIGDTVTDKCNDVVSTVKKKKKDKHSVSDEVVSSQKVKKTKKRKQKDVDDIVGDGIGIDDDCVRKKKKKGKKEKSCDSVVNSVSGSKKKKKGKKKKKRDLNERKDVENGDNTCGSSVSKSKKKTIEKVVDTANMALENPNGVQPTGGNSSPASNLGQWGTATFENKERQDKFYRLLGGFKKRGDALVQNTAGTNSVKKLKPYVNPNSPFLKKNLALSSSDAKNLDDNLEKDFNRAMEWKLTMPRGTGIGYTPPPDANKLFYIDKTKSTSVKFD